MRKKRSAKTRSDIEKRLQKRVRELRRGSGFTIAQLAEEAGLSTDAATRIEGGDRVPTLNSVAAISKALGVTVSELLDEPEPQHSPIALRLVRMTEAQPPSTQKAIVELVKLFTESLEKAR